MATSRTSSKAQAETETVDANAETAEAPGPETTGPKVVPFIEGPEHGYVGQIHPEKDNEAYTVAGVTGSTASPTDKPSRTSVDAREAWAPLQG